MSFRTTNPLAVEGLISSATLTGPATTESALPPFLVSMVNLATTALRLQKSRDSTPSFYQSLFCSVIESSHSEYSWIQAVMSTTAERFPNVKQRLDSHLGHLKACFDAFATDCHPDAIAQDPAKNYYTVFTNSLADVAEVVCRSHEIVIFTYVDCVEISAQKSDELCVALYKTTSSGVQGDIISAFEVLTNDLVNLVASMQQMAIQSTTPDAAKSSLTYYSNTISFFNGGLANTINDHLRARDDPTRLALLKTVEQIQENIKDVVEEMERERHRIAELNLFTNFMRVVTTIREFNSLELSVVDDEHALIEERGAMARLLQYQKDTGYQPSVAVEELAKSSDKLEGILEDMQFTLSFQPENLSSLAESLNIASPTILKLTEPTKAVLQEQAAKISELAKHAKEAFAEDIEELQSISARLEMVVKGEGSSPEQLKILAESKASVKRILEKSYTNPKDPESLDNEEYTTLKSALSKLSLNEPEVHEPDVKVRARRLSNLASLARKEILQADKDLEVAQNKSKNLMEVISNEIKRSVQEKHNQLVVATKNLLENGHGEGRESKVSHAVEQVNDLLELSVSLIPSSREGAVTIGESPWKPGETDVPRPEPQESFLHRMLHTKKKKSFDLRSSSLDLFSTDSLPKLQKRQYNGVVKNIVQDFELQLADAKTPKARKLSSQELLSLRGAESRETLVRPRLLNPLASPSNIWNETGGVEIERSSESEEGKATVVSGNLNQLIIHLTSPNEVDGLVGAEFFQTFMVTLQTFTDPETFVRKMIERFECPPRPDDMSSEYYLKNFKQPVQMRVSNVLKKWIQMRFDQDFSTRPELIQLFSSFLDEKMQPENEFYAKNLKQCLHEILLGRSVLSVQQALEQGNAILTPGPKPPAAFHRSKFPGLDSLQSFNINELANQMTLIDSELFRIIKLSDLAGQAWNKPDGNAVNLLRMINFSTRVTLWVANEILAESKLKKRRKVMKNMIMLAQALRELRNFNGVMSILAGLSSAAITRLRYTKNELSAKTKQILLGIESEMSSLGSFKVYRKILKERSPPVIPFLGVPLSDLTFIEDGNPDLLTDGRINWQKRTLLHKVLLDFTDMQRACRYPDIKETHMRKSFLLRTEEPLKSAQELYDISLQLEPREALQPQTSSMVLTGFAKFVRTNSTLSLNSFKD